MSTIGSPPTIEGQRNHVAGFNGHTHYDPFLPSSPSEEQLLQVTSDFLPDSQSHHPSPSSGTNFGSSKPSASPPGSYGHHQQATKRQHPDPYSYIHTNGFHNFSSPAQTGNDSQNFATSSDFLSQTANFSSENEYSELSEHTTPYLDNDFSLENDFGPLAALEEEYNLGPRTDSLNTILPGPTSVGTHAVQSNNTSRASFGTATLSSHLMSPVLTDTASLVSGDEFASPIMDANFFEGSADMISSTLGGDSGFSRRPQHTVVPMQQTPTMTSNEASPEPARLQRIAHAASPVVRVESYSRGDSPARNTLKILRSESKRSRSSYASSHLAPVQDHDSDEEDDIDHFDPEVLSVPMHRNNHRAQDYTFSNEVRAGLDPQARMRLNDDYVPNFKDQEESAQMAQKKAEVEDWLTKSEAGSEVEDNSSQPATTRRSRRSNNQQRGRGARNMNSARADRSSLIRYQIPNGNSPVPGPGLLLDEQSDDEDEDSDEGSMAGSTPDTFEDDEAEKTSPDGYFPKVKAEGPLYRSRVWQDPVHDATVSKIQSQPLTANDAIKRFYQVAGEADIETASRAATWGTRRMSEGDLQSIFQRLNLDHEKGPAKDQKGERQGSLFDKLFPRRSSSILKRLGSERSKRQTHPTVPENPRKESLDKRKESLGSLAPSQRTAGVDRRPKSPNLNTGSAVAAMTTQIATFGANGSFSLSADSSPTNAWASAKKAIKRSRSRSELHRPSSSSGGGLGLADLLYKQGGPPMPTLASPPKETPVAAPFAAPAKLEEDDDEDEAMQYRGVVMDLGLRSDTITPTFEGFKYHVQQLNQNLIPFMVDRVAHEQLRRFKKLVDFKVKHAKALSIGKCGSGDRCVELGGQPSYLMPKTNHKEPELSHTGFSVAGLGVSDDEDANALTDGVVTPAQFPAGVPMPPVKRLPAEFECSLCFKVKKFHKPSDWSKHVHEDLQPFTCTFADCSEPKSFKRKADWVRHESERHRQLEWWMCNLHDCAHRCYRKDNFVQHLVREHKLPEPKGKTAKPDKPAVRGPSNNRKGANNIQSDQTAKESARHEVDQVWTLVEQCKHAALKDPKEEPCKFCGNICNSWKKLTVHLAKHMEQISMPVLGLVKEIDVTPETTISPIDQRTSQQTKSSSAGQARSTRKESVSLSPFDMPADMPPSRSEIDSLPMLQPQEVYFVNPTENDVNGTYPPASHAIYPSQMSPQNPAVGYDQDIGSAFSTSGYDAYNNDAAIGFMPVNPQRGYSHARHSSNPESLYNPMRELTPQPRSAPYTGDISYQTGYEQQHAYSGPPESSFFTYEPNSQVPYGLQSQISQPVPLQYNAVPRMPFSAAPNDIPVYHANQQHGYGFQRQ
ncbi:hypothetical protein MMC12_003591 [Toensbergia leucococca]|nr:hypothetical protein [Toensbergia leucococca]